MAARNKNSSINLEITNTGDGFGVVGGNNRTGSLGVYSGSINMIADTTATEYTYEFPSQSGIITTAKYHQELENKTLKSPKISGLSEQPSYARVLLYNLSTQEIGYTASSAFGGGGGGGGTPGGSDTWVQYNEAGVFGGENVFRWDYDVNRLSVTGSTSLDGTAFISGALIVSGTFVNIGDTTIEGEMYSLTANVLGHMSTAFITASGARFLSLTQQNYPRVLVTDTNGNLAYTASSAFGGGGGSTSPGGSNENIQYNDGGTFNGSNSFRWVNASTLVAISGSIVTQGGITIGGNGTFQSDVSFNGSVLTNLNVDENVIVTKNITGSSAKLTGLTLQPTYPRVLVSDTQGNIAYTASSAFGGGGGGIETRTGVYRTFYIPAAGGEYNEIPNLIEETGSFGDFKTRYLRVPAPATTTTASLSYTFTMPTAWSASTNIRLYLYAADGDAAPGDSYWNITAISFDPGEDLDSPPTPTGAGHLLSHGNNKHYIPVNSPVDVTIAGTPTTSSIIFLNMKRTDSIGEGTKFTADVLLFGFDVQYLENTTEPTSR